MVVGKYGIKTNFEAHCHTFMEFNGDPCMEFYGDPSSSRIALASPHNSACTRWRRCRAVDHGQKLEEIAIAMIS